MGYFAQFGRAFRTTPSPSFEKEGKARQLSFLQEKD